MRRCGQAGGDSGARNGPAGNTQALPRPRSPSITISEASLAIAGFWKPSSNSNHAGTLRPRQRDAIDAIARDGHRNRPRQHQRLVADIGRRP
jgi:hypothetical protein